MKEFLFLVKQNIKHQAVKYGYIFAIVLVSSLSILVSSTVSFNIQKGIDSAKDRLGADIVVTARDSGVDFEEVLYNGEPVTSKISGINTEDIKGTAHVTKTASRLYMASLEGMSCCDDKVQLIAVDEGDYLLKSWAGNLSVLNSSTAIVGSRLGYKEGGTAKFFGREFTVAKVIEKTGTGVDLSVFISRDTAGEIMADERYADIFKGYSKEDNSAVFVSSDNPKVTENILKSRFGNKMDVFVADKRVSEYTGRISAVKVVLNVAVAIINGLSVLSVLAITSVQTVFRGREAGAYLIAKKSKGYVVALWSTELALVTTAATIISSGIFLWVFGAFKNSIEIALKTPIAILPWYTTLTIAVIIAGWFIFSAGAIVSGSSWMFKSSAGELVKERN